MLEKKVFVYIKDKLKPPKTPKIINYFAGSGRHNLLLKKCFPDSFLYTMDKDDSSSEDAGTRIDVGDNSINNSDDFYQI